MRQSQWLLCAAVSAVVGMSLTCFAQEAKKADKEPAKEAIKETEEKEPAKRLPPHYKDVVTESQRTEIYKLQESYNAKIAALADEIKKLQADRITAIEALLSAEQKKKLADIKAAAAAKAKDKTAEVAKPKEESAPVEAAKPVVPSTTKPAKEPSTIPPVAPPAVPKPAKK